MFRLIILILKGLTFINMYLDFGYSVQVDDDDEFYNGPDNSDYDTDDSNGIFHYTYMIISRVGNLNHLLVNGSMVVVFYPKPVAKRGIG